MEGAYTTLQKVRLQIESRGVKTVRGLGRVFRQLDSYDGNKKVDKGEFFIGLKECGVQITQQEAYDLMRLLDTNNDGFLDFEQLVIEFSLNILAIRGKPNARRQSMIDKAFLKFDRDGSGAITGADLKNSYNAKFHPKVQNGQMTENQVFMEFLQNFGDVNKDGTITRSEWNDYYAAVSSSVDNDDHFVLLMKQAWKLE